MSTDASDVWSRLLAQARNSVGTDVLRTWLEPITPVKWEDPTLTVSVPDQFSLDWTESKYADLLTSFAPIALGHPVILVFQVDPERQERPQIDLFSKPEIVPS